MWNIHSPIETLVHLSRSFSEVYSYGATYTMTSYWLGPLYKTLRVRIKINSNPRSTEHLLNPEKYIIFTIVTFVITIDVFSGLQTSVSATKQTMMAVNSHLVIDLMNIYYFWVTHAVTLPNRSNPGRHMTSITNGQSLSFREDLIVLQTIRINIKEFCH